MSSISGFPEWLPAQQQILEQWKNLLARHFEKFCFAPMDTPVVERMSTLLSKGEDSEIYALSRWADIGNSQCPTPKQDRQLGLRFDLTVPLARYVAQHHGQLVFPYRRHHIAPVWRGERPQEGRFRQFYQCDIDTINQDSLHHAYDADTIFILHSALNALNIGTFLGPVHWHLNHRAVLLSWAQYAGIADSNAALRLIDKSEKIGLDGVLMALRDLRAKPDSLEILQSWSQHTDSAHQQIHRLCQLKNWPDPFYDALENLKETIKSLSDRGMSEECLFFSPLLARGLSYYSGITFEAKLPNHRDLGSVCAGGRYDDLTTVLGSKKTFPGVGGSLGLSRLFARFAERTAPVLQLGDILICSQDAQHLAWYTKLGDALRQDGWRVEVFLGEASLKNQLKYANRKGFRMVLLANAEEIQNNLVQVKAMDCRQQELVAVSELPAFLDGALPPTTVLP
jgi:histidyl-tRNA synthetase